jgi:hypothetical protein
MLPNFLGCHHRGTEGKLSIALDTFGCGKNHFFKLSPSWLYIAIHIMREGQQMRPGKSQRSFEGVCWVAVTW